MDTYAKNELILDRIFQNGSKFIEKMHEKPFATYPIRAAEKYTWKTLPPKIPTFFQILTYHFPSSCHVNPYFRVTSMRANTFSPPRPPSNHEMPLQNYSRTQQVRYFLTAKWRVDNWIVCQYTIGMSNFIGHIWRFLVVSARLSIAPLGLRCAIEGRKSAHIRMEKMDVIRQ